MSLGSYQTQFPKIYPGLVLWLDANDPAGNNTQPANASAVATWVDKSGNGRNFTQATGTSQPTYRLNIQGGKPVLRFDGTDDFLSNTSVYTLPSSDCTIFMVLTSAATSVRALSFSTSGSGGRGYLVPTNSNTAYGFNIGTSAGGSAAVDSGTLTNFNIVTCYRSGNTLSANLNNGTETTATNTNVPITDLGKITLGASDTGASLYLNGDVAELMIFSSKLSSSAIVNINRDLSNKWGIAIS